MKILIVTQKVSKNDPILGFFHRWLIRFAQAFESVIVICLEEGEHDLPANVKVYSLGKEKLVASNSWSRKIMFARRFLSLAWKLRNEYDTVFVHMNPEYVVIAGWMWRLLSKKISLWYIHRSINLKLRIATLFANKIFSASDKSFPIQTSKLVVTGHGIDTDQFSPNESKTSDGVTRLISVGRISKIKNYEEMIRAVAELVRNKNLVTLSIVGGPVYEAEKKYEADLKRLVTDLRLDEIVKFYGSATHDEIPSYLNDADIFLSLCDTGSFDKALLEAMSSGLNVLTSNKALANILPPENITNGSVDDVVRKLAALMPKEVNANLRAYILAHHSLPNLIGRIKQELIIL